MNFETIKKYFALGMWSEQMVLNAVKKAVITTDEYTLITGKKIDKPVLSGDTSTTSSALIVSDTTGEKIDKPVLSGDASTTSSALMVSDVSDGV